MDDPDLHVSAGSILNVEQIPFYTLTTFLYTTKSSGGFQFLINKKAGQVSYQGSARPFYSFLYILPAKPDGLFSLLDGSLRRCQSCDRYAER